MGACEAAGLRVSLTECQDCAIDLACQASSGEVMKDGRSAAIRFSFRSTPSNHSNSPRDVLWWGKSHFFPLLTLCRDCVSIFTLHCFNNQYC